GNYDAAPRAAIDCRVQACAPAQAASFDRARFMRMLEATLPNAHASVRCNASAPGAFDSTCRLQIDWSQHAQASTAGTAPQTLVWMFQP
ncbi:MAG: hypothetical protein ABI846_15590, partial [Rudaea sp.]